MHSRLFIRAPIFFFSFQSFFFSSPFPSLPTILVMHSFLQPLTHPSIHHRPCTFQRHTPASSCTHLTVSCIPPINAFHHSLLHLLFSPFFVIFCIIFWPFYFILFYSLSTFVIIYAVHSILHLLFTFLSALFHLSSSCDTLPSLSLSLQFFLSTILYSLYCLYLPSLNLCLILPVLSTVYFLPFPSLFLFFSFSVLLVHGAHRKGRIVA